MLDDVFVESKARNNLASWVFTMPLKQLGQSQLGLTVWLCDRVCHGFRLTKRGDYFESLLTTFGASIIFRGSWVSSKNWLEAKTRLTFPN